MTFRDLISETDYAEQRGVSIRSVQRERAQRVGPPFIKVGRKVYYRPAAIEAWLLSMEQIQPRSSRAST
jgi:hypothetical protein